MPHSQKNQNLKQKQYCNTFHKDVKMVPIKKKKKKTNLKTIPNENCFRDNQNSRME